MLPLRLSHSLQHHQKIITMAATYHPIRIWVSVIATVGSTSMLLPWTKLQQQGFGWVAENSQNGFANWGFISMAGIFGIIAATLMGDKLKPFDANGKLIVLASFAAIALGAIITLTQTGTNPQTGVVSKPGIGPWFAIAAGIAGILVAAGIIKIPVKPAASSQAPSAPAPDQQQP